MTLRKDDRIKLKAMGTSELSISKEAVELRYLEQLKDQEQSMALAYLLKYVELRMLDGRKDLRQIGDLLEDQLDRSGLESLFERGEVSAQLARPRKQEILACYRVTVKQLPPSFVSETVIVPSCALTIS